MTDKGPVPPPLPDPELQWPNVVFDGKKLTLNLKTADKSEGQNG